MHSILFIQDLAIVMLIAGLITVLCHRFKQPIVLGYIIAGMIIGPYTPPFALISDEVTIKTLAELGVIFLMFSLGLEFNLRKLSKVGITALIAAVAEITLMIWLGYEIGILFKWKHLDALFLGAILAISSTTIIVRALNELGMKKEKFAQLIFGILVIEDIFAILILALLSSIASTGTVGARDFFVTITTLSSFLVVSLLGGLLVVPRLLAYIAKFHSREMLLISVLAICFGFCLLVVQLNYSVALGAFIAGAVIAESQQLEQIEPLIAPLCDMFSAIFFVSVGLLLDPKLLIDFFWPITLITLVVIIGKVSTASFGLMVAGRHPKTAMRVGMGLAQIGEFSFIIASLGINLNVTSDFLYPIAVAVSAITTLFTPYLIKYSDQVTHHLRVLVPEKVASVFKIYAIWLSSIRRPQSQPKEVAALINQYLLKILINLFVVIAVFLSGSYVARTKLGSMLIIMSSKPVQQTVIWGVALLISLPFLVAIYGKIKALSMLIAQFSVHKINERRLTLAVRKILSELIPLIAMGGIMLFICILSASILPPLQLLMIVFIIAIIVIALLFPWFIKLHARLQLSLLASLKNSNHHEKE